MHVSFFLINDNTVFPFVLKILTFGKVTVLNVSRYTGNKHG